MMLLHAMGTRLTLAEAWEVFEVACRARGMSDEQRESILAGFITGAHVALLIVEAHPDLLAALCAEAERTAAQRLALLRHPAGHA
jgi:hypothetical protein